MQSLTAGEALGLFCAAVALAAVVPLWWNLRRLEKEVEGLQELRQLVEQFEYTRIPQAERHGVAPPEEGHPVGAEAPDFLLRNITGEEVALKDVLQPGKLTALMFVSTNCATCRELLPLIKRWDDKHDEFLKIVLISKGSLEENLKRIRAYQTRHLLIHEDSEVAQAYHTRWTPSAVLVDANGRIASPIRVGKGQIRHLIEHTVTLAASKQPGPVRLPEVVLGDSLFKVGDPAPRFALPDLEGRPVSLEQLLDRPNLLVFWTSDCSHCVSLGPELEQWEQGIDPNSPRLVLIASGDAEEIRRILGNLSLLTLMDPDFEIGPLFGVTNTPSAVLVDRFGRIASSLAQGRKRIFTLVGFKPRWANQRPA